MKSKGLLSVGLIAFSTIAHAHPGHGLESAYSGFMHPLTGWDHLLVMFAIGLWAARLGGKARWQLPLTFVAVMALGAALGASGLYFTGVETAIAASVMAMGMLLIMSMPMKLSTQLGITALFAVLHGMAHGAELQVTSMAAFAGMMAATAVLHVIGLAVGLQRFKFFHGIEKPVAYLMLCVGAYLLVA